MNPIQENTSPQLKKPVYSLEEIMKFNNNIQMRDELIISLQHSEKKNQTLTKLINNVANILETTPNNLSHISNAIDTILKQIYDFNNTHPNL
jgi:translation initiation factor 2B subunit (eIF-2B alpha/beta/delta family)|tara:strand:- start:160 stop:435 length:276 start_codon:yes stop_codon:yes gene_type:complete